MARKIIFLMLLLFIVKVSEAQVIGVGTRYSDNGGKNFPFSANISLPNPAALNIDKKHGTFFLFGADYNAGSSTFSGLNLKPLQFDQLILKPSKKSDFSTYLGIDGGYLINFKGGENGLIASPHIGLEFSILFAKAGYDFNLTGNKQQFFVRFGLCAGLGLLYSIENMKFGF